MHPMMTEPSVESLVGHLATAFRLPKSDQDEVKLELVRQRFGFHYHANAFFRAQCEQAQVSPDSLQSLQDLTRIPLIPIRTFKQPGAHVLLSVPLTQIDMEMRSVASSGIPSVARRDSATTTLAALVTVGVFREFCGFIGGVGLFICPSPAETPEMGLVRFLNGVSALLDDRVYMVREYQFQPEEAIAYLEQWADRQTRHIFGAPALINRLLRHLEKNDIRLQLDPRSYVVTTGGWARHTGESLKAQTFTQELQTYLGVRPENVRDIYGVIETNLLAFECEHHFKHVAPWCHVSVRDMRDSSVEMPVGQTGVIAILDAMGRSHPGFLLTEDVGKIDQDGLCACGRVGQTLTFNRRLRGAEVGCCAVSIEKFMDSREIVPECELPQATPST